MSDQLKEPKSGGRLKSSFNVSENVLASWVAASARLRLFCVIDSTFHSGPLKSQEGSAAVPLNCVRKIFMLPFHENDEPENIVEAKNGLKVSDVLLERSSLRAL